MKTYDVVVIQANERAIGCNHHLGINTCAHAIHHVAQVQLLRTRATWRGIRESVRKVYSKTCFDILGQKILLDFRRGRRRLTAKIDMFSVVYRPSPYDGTGKDEYLLTSKVALSAVPLSVTVPSSSLRMALVSFACWRAVRLRASFTGPVLVLIVCFALSTSQRGYTENMTIYRGSAPRI